MMVILEPTFEEAGPVALIVGGRRCGSRAACDTGRGRSVASLGMLMDRLNFGRGYPELDLARRQATMKSVPALASAVVRK